MLRCDQERAATESRLYRLTGRTLDFVEALGLLIVSSPLWVLAAVLIKLAGGGGGVIYAGLRVGRGGTPFRMYKFRTMVADADLTGGPSTAANDPRTTVVGRWLRRYKLDELPQVLNVLAGQMSIVGPRPQVPSDVARYSAEELHLLDVKPGITDWASIYFRNEGEILANQADPDEAYDRLIRPRKLSLGLEYVRTASFATDLRVLTQTARVLCGRQPRLPPDLQSWLNFRETDG